VKRIYWRGIEVEVFIKVPGRIVDRVDHHSPDTDDIRGLFDSLESIEQESLPE
jgi:hypothetical protein